MNVVKKFISNRKRDGSIYIEKKKHNCFIKYTNWITMANILRNIITIG